MIRFYKFLLIALLGCQNCLAQQLPVYRDAKQPLEARVNDLLSKLTLAEKASLLGYQSKAV